MSLPTLSQTSFSTGLWKGRLESDVQTSAPQLAVLCDGAPTQGLRVTATPGRARCWDVTFELPRTALSEGTQTFLFVEEPDNTVLYRLSIIAGIPATEDIRAEVAALRAELDQLRAAFRAEMRAAKST